MRETHILLALVLLCVGIYGAFLVFMVMGIFDILRAIQREIKNHQKEKTS